jgi:hypothetical protein
MHTVLCTFVSHSSEERRAYTAVLGSKHTLKSCALGVNLVIVPSNRTASVTREEKERKKHAKSSLGDEVKGKIVIDH